MRWRDFKTESEGKKGKKPQKPPMLDTSMAFIPFIPFIPPRGFENDPLWLKWKDNPQAVKQFAANLAGTDIRKKGELPREYIKTVECQSCGPVLLPAGVPEKVPACVWCLNRAAGLPIPRPI